MMCGHRDGIDLGPLSKQRGGGNRMDIPPDRGACETRQESGPPEKSEAGAEIGYNDKSHKALPYGLWGW